MDAVVLPVLLLSLGALVAVANGAGALQAIRRRRRGDRRGFSAVPLLGLLFVLGAAAANARGGHPPLPAWLFWLVAMADVATWSLFFLPLFLVSRRFARPVAERAVSAPPRSGTPRRPS